MLVNFEKTMYFHRVSEKGLKQLALLSKKKPSRLFSVQAKDALAMHLRKQNAIITAMVFTLIFELVFLFPLLNLFFSKEDSKNISTIIMLISFFCMCGINHHLNIDPEKVLARLRQNFNGNRI